MWKVRHYVDGNQLQRSGSDDHMDTLDPTHTQESLASKGQRRTRSTATLMVRTRPATESESSANKHLILRKSFLIKHANQYRAFELQTCRRGVSDVTTEASGSGGSAALDDVAKRVRTVQGGEMEVSATDAPPDAQTERGQSFPVQPTQLHRAKNQIGNQ